MSRLWDQARQTLRGQFIVLATCCFLLSLILAAFFWQSLNRASGDLETIASGSVPSVDAAQALAQYTDDIDAKAADYLATGALTEQSACTVMTAQGSTNVGMLTVHDCDQRNIDAEIILTNQQLYNAIHNATYPGERTATERIAAGLEEYASYWTIMQQEYTAATNKADPADPHLLNAYSAYQRATAVLHTKIQRSPILAEKDLPTCKIGIDQHVARPDEWVNGGIESNVDCLNDINYSHLNQAYADTEGFLTGTRGSAILLCLIFGLGLAFTTFRLLFVNHRLINPGLAPALLLGVILSFLLIGVFNGFVGSADSTVASEHGSYQQMVKDDYASVYAAAQLKRYGTNANADESRWLVAKTFSKQDEANKWEQDWSTNTAHARQVMATARANQTWDEEKPPLAAMDTNWASYTAIDSQIRTAANSGDIHSAEVLSTGKSNTTFGDFSTAVDALGMANYHHYNDTLDATRGVLSVYQWLSLLLFPLIGILAGWGVSQRLKDF